MTNGFMTDSLKICSVIMTLSHCWISTFFAINVKQKQCLRDYNKILTSGTTQLTNLSICQLSVNPF